MDILKLESILEEDGIVFFTSGFFTQSLIVGLTESLEKQSEESDWSMGQSNNIITVFIELSQNIMNYSAKKLVGDKEFDTKGLILAGKNDENSYYLLSKNIICLQDKNIVDAKLKEIISSDRETIKKLYKEKRRSGAGSHGKGAGIGFYEIAKRCKAIEYSFQTINDDSFYFIVRTTF